MPLAVIEILCRVGEHWVPRQSKHAKLKLRGMFRAYAPLGRLRLQASETRKIDSDQQPRRWFVGAKCLLDWWLSYLPHFLPLPTLSTFLVIGCSGLSDRVIFTTATNSTTGTRHTRLQECYDADHLRSCISTLSVTRAFGSMSAHGRLTLHVQFEVSTPHVLYACLGGFVVFVCHPFACYAQHTPKLIFPR
jgi:hypothetical protein